MSKTAISIVILLFLIVADVSVASSFWKLRFLADESPPNNNTAAAATPQSSQLPTKKLDPKPEGQSKLDPKPEEGQSKLDPKPEEGQSKLDPNPAAQPPVVKKDPKRSDKPVKEIPPPPQREIDSRNSSSSTSNPTNAKTMEDENEKKKNIDSGKKPNGTETELAALPNEDKNKEQKKTINEDGNGNKSGIDETCDGVANSCKDGNSLTACLKGFETGSKQLVVLVVNSGGKTLRVNVAGPSGESFAKGVKVPKHGTGTINITSISSKSGKLLLNAGNGDCVLRVNPLESERNFFVNLPSYDKLLTPVNGAYFSIAAVVILGASCACWMFRKRRRHDGIPYQELEMGLPESMEATEVETAEGWDEGWDSDWDEDKAVKSPVGRRHVPNISANGLTIRSSNRDGWENDWDD